MHGFKPVTSVQKIVNKIVDPILENVGGNNSVMQCYLLGYIPDEKIRLKCFELAYQTKCTFTVKCISRFHS